MVVVPRFLIALLAGRFTWKEPGIKYSSHIYGSNMLSIRESNFAKSQLNSLESLKMDFANSPAARGKA